MNKLYRSSIFLRLAPLIIGTCIFILADILMLLGNLTIIGGLISVIVAAIFLGIYLFKEKPEKINIKRGLVSRGLIFADFLLVFLFAFIAITIITSYSLKIKNDSSSTIYNLSITAPGVNITIDKILPKEKIRKRFKIKYDGGVSFSAIQNEKEFGSCIEYATTVNLGGGSSVLVIKDNCKYEVRTPWWSYEGTPVNLRELNTKLIYAEDNNDIEQVRHLLKRGADANSHDEDGKTVLMNAAQHGRLELVKMLLDAKANVNAKEHYNETALMFASMRGKTDVVMVLVKAKADINIKNKSGETALWWAVYYGYSDIVKILLDAGADVNIQDKSGKTVLMLAKEKGHAEIINLLKEYGANPPKAD